MNPSPSVTRSEKNRRANGLIWLLGLTALALVALFAEQARLHLGQAEAWTGYSLFGLFLILAAFGLRKRLSMVPMGRAFWWHQVHIIGGVIAGMFYLLHVDSLWPEAGYERVLAGLVYLLLLTGIGGYVLQFLAPRRLARNPEEILFERIPAALDEIRSASREQILAITQQQAKRGQASETLVRFHQESLDWYLRQPRFLLSHLFGGQKGEHWIDSSFSALRRYTSDAENEVVDELEALARRKADIDKHYAMQGTMKLWLLLHIPCAAATLILVLWHLLLVNIYVL